MSIAISDPLAFLLSTGGKVNTPLTEGGAGGAENLDVPQRSAVIGEVIPIVFCRRVSGIGGVLISPPATEARFENDTSNAVTGYYHLVLGEGPMDSIQVRDVFQRSCRVGTFTQTYNRRAGTWTPGNFIVARAGYTTPQCPYYCGTSGTYAGLSTLSHQCTYPDGVDQWNRQVHCFIRGGLHVPRLLDSVTGPSNNVADLLLYLLRNSSKVPEAQIDTASLLSAATFTNVNGFWFNGQIKDSTNLRDWMGNTLQYFLLRQTRISGKEGLKPMLPTNANGTIKTTAVTWAFTFTEEHIIPESVEINYTPLSERKPFCAVVLWRQQDDNGIGIVRTAEVRYTGTAEAGPFEQHDLSSFCASENHAVKVGAYILSKRNHVTHRLQLSVKPDAFNPTLATGDLVRVRLERVASTGPTSLHDYLYEVDRIGKSITGEVKLELTHFPVDSNRASVVAQEVAAATGTGIVLPTGLTGVTCDVNSASDTSIPAESFTTGSFPNYGVSFGGLSEAGLGDPPVNNPSEAVIATPSITTTNNPPMVGDTATAPVICEGGRVNWYRLDPSVNGGRVYLTQGPTYIMTLNDKDYSVYAEVECPDPSSPTGYGEPMPVGATPKVQRALPSGFSSITGTISIDGNTTFSGVLTYSYWDRIGGVCQTVSGGFPLTDPRQNFFGGTAEIAYFQLEYNQPFGTGTCQTNTGISLYRVPRSGPRVLSIGANSPGGISGASVSLTLAAATGTAAPWQDVWP